MPEMIKESGKPEEKFATKEETNLQSKSTELVVLHSATAQPLMASADFQQKDQLNTALQNQNVQETYDVTKAILTNMEHDSLNAVRSNAGLKPLEAIHNPTLKDAALSETAAEVSKNLLYQQGVTVGFLTQITKLENVNNVDGAEKLRNDMESILKTTTTKQQAEAELQNIKTKYVESGDTDLASAIGEIQETSNQTWNKVNEWQPEKTVANIVPSMFAKKFVSEYVQKIMSNVDAFLKNYSSKIAKSDLDENSKSELMKEAEETKEASQKLDKEIKNNGKFDEIFEKHLKNEMDHIKKNIKDVETLSQINRIENGGKVEIDSNSLLIENMHPTVSTGVMKAYRAAVDEAMTNA